MVDHAKLTDERWRTQRTAIKRVGKKTKEVIKAWAKIAQSTVADSNPEDWRWLMADLRNRCQDDPDNEVVCPYTTTYLVHLAQTWEKWGKQWDELDVSPSVLIEGRHLKNLPQIIKQEKAAHDGEVPVSRIKAHVAKKANKDERPIAEIEREMKDKRDGIKQRAARKREAQKIEFWASDKSDDLLPDMREKIEAFTKATKRLHSKGKVFELVEVRLTLDAAQQLVKTLEEEERRSSDSGLAQAA